MLGYVFLGFADSRCDEVMFAAIDSVCGSIDGGFEAPAGGSGDLGRSMCEQGNGGIIAYGECVNFQVLGWGFDATEGLRSFVEQESVNYGELIG